MTTTYSIEDDNGTASGSGIQNRDAAIAAAQHAADRTQAPRWVIADDGSEPPLEVTPAARAGEICSALSDLDDGTGEIGIIVRQAVADDPGVTAAEVRKIVAQARRDAAVERLRDQEEVR